MPPPMPSEPTLTAAELECRMDILRKEMQLLEAQRQLVLAKERGERVAKAAREEAASGEAPAAGEQGSDTEAREASAGGEEWGDDDRTEEDDDGWFLPAEDQTDQGAEIWGE